MPTTNNHSIIFSGKRTIITAVFSNEIGPLSIYDLINMGRSEWTLLRNMITANNITSEAGVEARCLMCGEKVFIATKDLNGIKYPYFKHFNNKISNCKWHSNKNININDSRSNKYHGQKESNEHKLMLNTIIKACQLDPRFINAKINQYLKPQKSHFGRYPDAFIEFSEIGKIAIEYQKSTTFQTEISGRNLFYLRERIPLLWILPEKILHDNIHQSFFDIIQLHRGTAFIFDSSASRASHRENKLVLNCYSVNNSSFIGSTLATIDEIKLNAQPLPFFFDNTISPLLKDIKERRRLLWRTIIQHDGTSLFEIQCAQFISDMKSRFNFTLTYLDMRFISVIYSLILNKFYINEPMMHKWNLFSNENNIRAMINSFLNSKNSEKFAALIIVTIEKLSLKKQLALSNFKKISDAINFCTQHSTESNIYFVLQYFFPEIFDEKIISKLSFFGETPSWLSKNTLCSESS